MLRPPSVAPQPRSCVRTQLLSKASRVCAVQRRALHAPEKPQLLCSTTRQQLLSASCACVSLLAQAQSQPSPVRAVQ
jgi:hypothetical protein